MQKLVQIAYEALWPEETLAYDTRVRYSGHFKGYNASIRLSRNTITVSLSRQWKGISPDIQVGLVQELLVRLLKKKKHTLNMDLYQNFLKQVHKVVPKTKTHPVLHDRFIRLNELYFHGLMELPNFAIHDSTRKLGTYEYGTDTISITKSLLQDMELLDYVLYHEMLHKKFKFTGRAGRHHHHTREFREWEQNYPGAAQLEKRLSRPRRYSLRQLFFG